MIPINPYLEALQAKYTAMQESISGVMTRAATEKRDLTEPEFRSLKEQSDLAKEMAEQIESLSEIETRNQKVAETGARVAAALATGDGGGGQGGGNKAEPLTGNASAKDRDPGHYTRASKNSFFGDMYRAKYFDDDSARGRMREHSRALDTAGEGVGLVAPKWMTDEFETMARQGRALANAVRNIPLGDDPRPMTLPKQTAGTEDAITDQVAENDPVGQQPYADEYDTDVDLVAPKPTSGKQLVSRQMVDMSSPAIDQLIYGDMMAVYNMRVENKVGAAIKAAGPAPAGNFLFATEAAWLGTPPATPGVDAIVRAQIAVRKARHLPADILAVTVDRYGELLLLKDTTGRPLMPEETAGPMNVIGVGTAAVDGRIKGLGVIATEGMGTGAKPDVHAAVRGSDTILFESNILRFRFEEQAGPESIVLGIWGYTAVIVRQGGKGVQRIQVTA